LSPRFKASKNGSQDPGHSYSPIIAGKKGKFTKFLRKNEEKADLFRGWTGQNKLPREI
jgi:hypothetical protein